MCENPLTPVFSLIVSYLPLIFRDTPLIVRNNLAEIKISYQINDSLCLIIRLDCILSSQESISSFCSAVYVLYPYYPLCFLF